MDIQTSNIKEWSSFMMKYKFALDEMNTKLKILNEEFQILHDHNPIEHIKSRLKKPKSISAKLERKNVKPTFENIEENVFDIAGIRVTCSFISDIYKIYDLIKNQDDIQIIKVKDYIANPKPNGYKSLHLIVTVPVFLTDRTENVCIEIQIRTIAMDFWASLEHKIYYKFQDEVPNKLTSELKSAAEMVHFLDCKMKDIKEEMDLYKSEESLHKKKQTLAF
ncbi:GTP pyrophosphokinase [Bacillus massiliigorillae]|uniref:GTP pyrophosphokinase n=1 Tax=Bacillus massiliigorillae TaxID=1243664 RepID=UPI0003A13C83|nr:GTP pyrophosphokinase family protein [Bacillus massiliigorillae]